MADILSTGPEHPRRPPRWLYAAGAGLVALASVGYAGFAVANRGSTPRVQQPATAATGCPTGGTVGGHALSGVALVLPGAAGAGLERHDPRAAEGPWTAIVRAPGGDLGTHEALVVFPAQRPAGGRAVRVGPVEGRSFAGQVTWPIAGGYATVRGDLPPDELLGIARDVVIAERLPQLTGTSTHRVSATVPSTSTVLREVRYGASDLGPDGALLGGLVYTGVTRTGELDAAVLSDQAEPAGTVWGFRAVVTHRFGGNAALAWEPKPGTVAYVGYSGVAAPGAAVGALHCLAARASMVSDAQWERLRPQTVVDSG